LIDFELVAFARVYFLAVGKPDYEHRVSSNPANSPRAGGKRYEKSGCRSRSLCGRNVNGWETLGVAVLTAGRGPRAWTAERSRLNCANRCVLSAHRRAPRNCAQSADASTPRKF
jgi:hypothetical protein